MRVLAVFYAVIAVAVASLTDRRIVGGLAFLGTMFIPSVVTAGIVDAAEPDGTVLGVLNLLGLPLILRDIVFEGRVDIDRDAGLAGVSGAGLAAVVLYVVLVGGALAVLHRRYDEGRQ